MAAFFIWGLFLLYWKPAGANPGLGRFCHRIVWSAVFVGVLLWQRHLAWLAASVRQPRLRAVCRLVAAAVGKLVDLYLGGERKPRGGSQLGYFINPLVNVLLGRVFLGERLSPPQALAVLLAALAWPG